MQKVFANGNERDTRDVLIKIDPLFIEFFFYDQYRHQENWIKEETERRLESGVDELDADEKRNDNFYWIGVEEWVRDKTERLDRHDNWRTHMKEKRWFSIEMEKFINDNT